MLDQSIQKNPPFLGYLSACSTTVNEVDALADKEIHIFSALQLAGFRHVVGTLWEVSDKHCVDVARVLYETYCMSRRALQVLKKCIFAVEGAVTFVAVIAHCVSRRVLLVLLECALTIERSVTFVTISHF